MENSPVDENAKIEIMKMVTNLVAPQLRDGMALPRTFEAFEFTGSRKEQSTIALIESIYDRLLAKVSAT
ncbi:hypothetical protein WM00_13810 [Burkholderia cepacia]|nr:hypothetical protein WM00_13810 [Burkholderia cepacia]